jgi:pyruvyltransferase
MIERLRYFAGLLNWGDDVNVDLYENITGKKPIKMHVLDKSPIEHIMMAGSILPFANEHTVVWGTGFMHRQSTMEGIPKKIVAVRGPLTLKRLQELGFDGKVVFGDPTMVLQLRPIAISSVGDEYEHGVIPHYIDRKLVEGWPDDILFIDIQERDFDKIYQQINMCQKIITSSLHGLILADIFEKPALWVKLSNNLAGDDMKFHDYFASIGRKDVEYFDLRGGYDDSVKDAFKPYKVDIDLDALYEACPLIQ